MSEPTKNILLLGSGYMAGAILEYLTKRDENRITVASNILKDAESLASSFRNTKASFLDVHKEDDLRTLIKNHDIVVSYVPAVLHPLVAKPCIAEKKHMVTASYISPALKELDEEVQKNGLIFLNEIGLDPGIDHLISMRIINEVREKGGKLLSYESWCGGLPCPDVCDNALGYKFSWSPSGALGALRNDAKFRRDGQEVNIPNKDVLFELESPDINMAFNLEGYYNRDSTKYIELYGIEDCPTVIRGTLRYKGFSLVIRSLIGIGILAQEPINFGKEGLVSWPTALYKLVENIPDSLKLLAKDDFEELLKKYCGSNRELFKPLIGKILAATLSNNHYEKLSPIEAKQVSATLVSALVNLDFLKEKEVFDTKKTVFENLVAHFEEKLKYKPGERDCVILQNKFTVQWKDQDVPSSVKVNLIMFGSQNGRSAMANTVGYPTAIATQLILDKVITKTGVYLPNIKEVYEPILQKIEELKIIPITYEYN